MDPQYGEEIISESGLELITYQAFYREAQKLGVEGLYENTYKIRIAQTLHKANDKNYDKHTICSCHEVYAEYIDNIEELNVDELDSDDELLDLSAETVEQESLPREEEFTF